jgi:putative FmdB family regulatory protein
MPLYVYECRDCQRRQERLEKIGEQLISPMCECGSVNTGRVMGVSNFQTRGGGWFRDGYSKKP